jgi:hypothetical protein
MLEEFAEKFREILTMVEAGGLRPLFIVVLASRNGCVLRGPR